MWQKISLLNPVVYLISGFRWSFYENSDVSLAISLWVIGGILLALMMLIRWMFVSGYRLKK